MSDVLPCFNRAVMCMEQRRESARHMRHRHGVVSYINRSLNAVGYALNAVLDSALHLRVKGCAWGWACFKCLAVTVAHALGSTLGGHRECGHCCMAFAT